MNSSETDFDRCCRLCAQENETSVRIFSKDAEALLVLNKLSQYLLIEIEENDSLPKNICIGCCAKLQIVCDFIDTARKAQDLLLKRSIMLDQIDPRIMLNSSRYVISNVTNQEIKADSMSDDESKDTMEVHVDPMMVLQNSEDSLSSLSDDEEIISEDVTHLHAVDKTVTITLMKKIDKLDVKPFVCVVCSKRFYTESALQNHTWVHSTESNDSITNMKKVDKLDIKPFPCVICKRSFCTELALKNHTWVHSSERHNTADTDSKHYHCNHCNLFFDFKYDLMAHLKEHRNRGLCKICGRVFRNVENLAAHNKSVHMQGVSYTCKVCLRSYNTKSNLKAHSITHSNDRPYVCHVCKKTFKRAQDLKFHINQHTGAKPYKCPFCDKSFASSGNCYSHRNRMHPGKIVKKKESKKREKKPLPAHYTPKSPNASTTVKGFVKYSCQMCDHTFTKRDNYAYHVFQHTGLKPFKCSFCTETFVTRRGLLRHHDKSHPSKNRPLALLSKNVLLK